MAAEKFINDISFLSAKDKIYEKIAINLDKIVGLMLTGLRNDIDVGIKESEKTLSAIMENE